MSYEEPPLAIQLGKLTLREFLTESFKNFIAFLKEDHTQGFSLERLFLLNKIISYFQGKAIKICFSSYIENENAMHDPAESGIIYLKLDDLSKKKSFTTFLGPQNENIKNAGTFTHELIHRFDKLEIFGLVPLTATIENYFFNIPKFDDVVNKGKEFFNGNSLLFPIILNPQYVEKSLKKIGSATTIQEIFQVFKIFFGELVPNIISNYYSLNESEVSLFLSKDLKNDIPLINETKC